MCLVYYSFIFQNLFYKVNEVDNKFNKHVVWQQQSNNDQHIHIIKGLHKMGMINIIALYTYHRKETNEKYIYKINN